MLLFSELVANHSRWLHAAPTAGLPKGAVAHAARDDAGRLKVLLVAKDLDASGSATVSVTLDGLAPSDTAAATPAHIVRLSAGSAAAKTGITLAGQTFDGTSDGSPSGRRAVEKVEGKVVDGKLTYAVQLPPLSAAMLVVDPPARPSDAAASRAS